MRIYACLFVFSLKIEKVLFLCTVKMNQKKMIRKISKFFKILTSMPHHPTRIERGVLMSTKTRSDNANSGANKGTSGNVNIVYRAADVNNTHTRRQGISATTDP